MEKRDIYKKALTTYGIYGIDAQITMVFEEMAELQKELCKNLRGKENRIEVAEEIADVEIMLDQMKIYFGIQDAVKVYKDFKLLRLEERLNK